MPMPKLGEKIARQLIKPEESWSTAHQKQLFWRFIRTPLVEGGLGYEPKKDDLKYAGENWSKFCDDSGFSATGNTAKLLADCEPPVCKASKREAVQEEYK